MVSSSSTLLTLSTASSYSSLSPNTTSSSSKNVNTFSPKRTQLKLELTNHNNNIHSLQCLSRLGSHSHQTQTRTLSSPYLLTASFEVSSTADKLKHLSFEFKSLSEPIDRVKRLLHYAALLPPLEESDRVPENRVTGCSTQVWVVAEMDEGGRMRFRADSDSEISKGFCWCLVWMLDGAEPEEVLLVKKEDLANMNVGLILKAQSRVNTWHNVLFAMQKATKDLVLDMEGKAFPSLVLTPDIR